jgi:KipI family sensor histidine kinase inhibitor
LVVEFGDTVDRALSDRVLRLAARLRAARPTGVTETVPTFRSLMIHYDPTLTSAAEIVRAVEAVQGREAAPEREARLWRVPACYDAPHAPDLEDVARRVGLSPSEIVSLHAETRYHVYMIGFLPGYPYMGDLPEPLRLPRRADPRIRVPPGSVAIATSMTAVYTMESPGGWHLIGATPVRFFDPGRTPPALLAPGDAVAFEPIGVREYEAIRASVETSGYAPPAERLAS